MIQEGDLATLIIVNIKLAVTVFPSHHDREIFHQVWFGKMDVICHILT